MWWNKIFLMFGIFAFFINCRWKFKHSLSIVTAENVSLASYSSSLSRNKMSFQMTSSLKNNTNNIWKESVLKDRRRHRRDIWQLYGVITCSTPCDPFILKDYGCYCGLGGTGDPVDSIDRCCMLHDYCYHNSPCHQALTYFLPYNWKCIAGRPHCSIPPKWNPAYACSFRLCECDRIFSECLQNYGCPKEKEVCRSDRFRRVWQKFLIKLGIG